tara:strand:- start:1941 stop:2072 length:132 start_codon:yes stop_codon:yes gene_type:complete
MTKTDFLNRLYEIRSKCESEEIIEHINKMIKHIEKMIGSGLYE